MKAHSEQITEMFNSQYLIHVYIKQALLKLLGSSLGFYNIY